MLINEVHIMIDPFPKAGYQTQSLIAHARPDYAFPSWLSVRRDTRPLERPVTSGKGGTKRDDVIQGERHAMMAAIAASVPSGFSTCTVRSPICLAG